MEYIPILKAKKNALFDCKDSTQLPPQKRQKIQTNLKLLEYSPWVTKGTILLGILFGVNWKKQVPMTRRQIPLACAAIGFSALSDYLCLQYVWSQHEADIVKLTGFKNGIYVNPARMSAMRAKMASKPIEIEEQFNIQDD